MWGLRQSFRPNGPSRDPFLPRGQMMALVREWQEYLRYQQMPMNMVGLPLFFLSLVLFCFFFLWCIIVVITLSTYLIKGEDIPLTK